LYPPPSREALQSHPAHFGIPILFPFPNRIAHGRYTFQGQTCQLQVRDQGNAIHGLVIDQPFRITARNASDVSATLICTISSSDLAQAGGFPFPFTFTVTFTLDPNGLTLTAQAVNTGNSPMPLGYGLHPYFPLPMSPQGTRDRCMILLPVTERWLLDSDLIPTGERRQLAALEAIHELQPLGNRQFDGVFTGILRDADRWTRARYTDPIARRTIIISGDRHIREWVLYTPPTAPAISFEPYTCTTDAFNLDERGIDAGRTVLDPNQTWQCTVRFSTEPFDRL
ncbi:MAG: aldose 1-epimerase, partial [Chloroflexi bacterium]|nr:aldose 1-epimerase [Chloroflexota bacterium]